MYVVPVGLFGGAESEFAVGITPALLGKGHKILYFMPVRGSLKGNPYFQWHELDLKASQFAKLLQYQEQYICYQEAGSIYTSQAFFFHKSSKVQIFHPANNGFDGEHPMERKSEAILYAASRKWKQNQIHQMFRIFRLLLMALVRDTIICIWSSASITTRKRRGSVSSFNESV